MSAIRLPSTFCYKILFSIAFDFAKLKLLGSKFPMLCVLGKYFWKFILKCSAISPARVGEKDVGLPMFTGYV